MMPLKLRTEYQERANNIEIEGQRMQAVGTGRD